MMPLFTAGSLGDGLECLDERRLRQAGRQAGSNERRYLLTYA